MIYQPYNPMQRIILALVLALMVLPAAVQAQADNPATQADAQIVQEVLGSTSAAPVTPQEAFDTIAGFGLSEYESGALSAFSLGAQGNLALTHQDGANNEALLEQDGNGNLAVLLQLGDGNLTTSRQVGTGNVFGVRIAGSYNELDVEQEGADNVYLLDYVGDGQMLPSAVQSGVGNQAVQVGEIAVPFGVQQYGNGMEMIIRHNGAQ